MDQPQYSIWLVPTSLARQKLSQAIIDLAAKYQSHWFVPHMTVLPNIEMSPEELLKRIEPVAKQIKPLTIEIEKIDTGNQYYRCVYAKLVKSPFLLELYQQVCLALDQPINSNWLAHLSLLYGEFNDTIKLAAQKDLESMSLPKSFAVDSISIWSSGPESEKWQEMGKLSFKE